jgi:hypothetical protein
MVFFILPLWSAQDLYIGPEGFSPRDDISYQSRADDKGQYEKGHALIYLTHIFLGKITCYCPSEEGR